MTSPAKVRQYWHDSNNPSMEDKYLLQLEIRAIRKYLGKGKLLEAGCGDGESTSVYSQIKGIAVTGIDYSPSRLKLARSNCPGVKFRRVDIIKKNSLGKFNFIVSQRLLVNLKNWQQQKQVIQSLFNHLNPGGKLILCEGSLQGVKILNQFRSKLKLKPIPVRWHNIFIDDDNLRDLGFKLVDGFGGYFLLTRGVRPYFDQNLNWDSRFNRLAKNVFLPIKYSRIKVWVYEAKS